MSFPPGGEDLSEFYDHTATHTPVGGGSDTVIDGNYYPEFVDPFNVLEAQKNVFRCALNAVTTFAHGDALVIGTTTYIVKSVQRNQPTVGEVMLMLAI
jgi:hypothetical protein